MPIVEHYMTPLVECVSVYFNETCGNVKQNLQRKRHHAAIVINGEGILEGIISVTNLMNADDDNPVSVWCTRNVQTVTRDKPIAFARHILRQNGISQLVVVDSQYRPLGIIWDIDVI